jgi:hypothetical protein
VASDERLAEQGREGEKDLNDWLSRNGLAYLYVNQTKESFASLFAADLKRPDFLVLIDSIGLIAVDAKNYKVFDRFGKPAYSLPWEDELRRTLTFERLFRIPVWYAYLAREDEKEVWYWISALKAVEVGEPADGKDGKFLWILRSDCERIEANQDLGQLFTHRTPTLKRISELQD